MLTSNTGTRTLLIRKYLCYICRTEQECGIWLLRGESHTRIFGQIRAWNFPPGRFSSSSHFLHFAQKSPCACPDLDLFTWMAELRFEAAYSFFTWPPSKAVATGQNCILRLLIRESKIRTPFGLLLHSDQLKPIEKLNHSSSTSESIKNESCILLTVFLRTCT